MPMAGNKKAAGKMSGWMILALIWLVAAILAVPTAIYCAAARPSDGNSDILALVIAFLAGPLYWIWFFAKGGYCQVRSPVTFK